MRELGDPQSALVSDREAGEGVVVGQAKSVLARDDLDLPPFRDIRHRDEPADPLVKTLELSAGYLDATSRGALLGTGGWPGEVLNDADAVQRAGKYFDYPAG